MRLFWIALFFQSTLAFAGCETLDLQSADTYAKTFFAGESTHCVELTGFKPNWGYVLGVIPSEAHSIIVQELADGVDEDGDPAIKGEPSNAGNFLIGHTEDLGPGDKAKFQFSGKPPFEFALSVTPIPAFEGERNDVWKSANLFNANVQGAEEPPHAGVVKLLQRSQIGELSSENPKKALDLGCETGKHTALLIDAGFKTDVLDISSVGLEYTVLNLVDSRRVQGLGKIFPRALEAGPFSHQHYDVVVGSYIFSFVRPELFESNLKKSFDALKEDGLFAAGFFGPEHDWAKSAHGKTFKSEKELRDLFEKHSMDVLEVFEERSDSRLAGGGKSFFQVFHVVAQKKKKP